MKPTAKTFLGILICMLGVVSLIAVIVPYQAGGDAGSIQEVITHSKEQSSIRFSERTVRLEPVHSGETTSGFILVENTGGKVITDVAIRAGCSCSDVHLSKTDMDYRDSIRVDFSIDTEGKYVDSVEKFLITYSENEQSFYDVFYVIVPIIASKN